MKKYFDSHYNPVTSSYDAVARRKECKVEYSGDKMANLTKKNNSAAETLSKIGKAELRNSENVLTNISNLPPNKSISSKLNPVPQISDQIMNDLKSQIAELRVCLDNTEKERNFYFRKLRDIEILTEKVQEEFSPISTDTKGLVEAILGVLYAVEDTEFGGEEFGSEVGEVGEGLGNDVVPG